MLHYPMHAKNHPPNRDLNYERIKFLFKKFNTVVSQIFPFFVNLSDGIIVIGSKSTFVYTSLLVLFKKMFALKINARHSCVYVYSIHCWQIFIFEHCSTWCIKRKFQNYIHCYFFLMRTKLFWRWGQELYYHIEMPPFHGWNHIATIT